MRVVRQLHENGCVPACLAMVTNSSYKKSLKLFSKNHDWEKEGVGKEAILRKLRGLGFSFRQSKPRKLSSLSCDAILLIEHSVYGPPGSRSHAVVWDWKNQRILDPYPSPRKKMCEQLTLRQYRRAVYWIIEVVKVDYCRRWGLV